MMKAAIYSPYLDTFGGGEKYMMTIAETLSQHNFDVDVLLDKNLIQFSADYLKDELSKRFNLDLTKTVFMDAPIGKASIFFSRLIFFRKYDVLFYLTDGSIFLPSSKKNFLHIQSPIIGEPAKSLWGKIKLKCWTSIIYNSNFTKNNSYKNWPLKSNILYPPVDINNIKPLNKKKYILSVGRFFGYLKDKKHDTLIKVFKDIFNSGQIKEWSLHLVGSASTGDKKYIDQLRNLAMNLPITFYPNLEYRELIRLYGQSSIYWHAAGYGETDPTKMEHFGISTVEAMVGGCVPIVIGKGGQLEIIEDKVSGYLWQTLEDLKESTLKLINEDRLRAQISRNAIKRSKKFSKDRFKESILEISYDK